MCNYSIYYGIKRQNKTLNYDSSSLKSKMNIQKAILCDENVNKNHTFDVYVFFVLSLLYKDIQTAVSPLPWHQKIVVRKTRRRKERRRRKNGKSRIFFVFTSIWCGLRVIHFMFFEQTQRISLRARDDALKMNTEEK